MLLWREEEGDSMQLEAQYKGGVTLDKWGKLRMNANLEGDLGSPRD